MITHDEAALAAAEQLDGKLLLVTNTDLEPTEVVSRCRSLADIERGFRVDTKKPPGLDVAELRIPASPCAITTLGATASQMGRLA